MKTIDAPHRNSPLPTGNGVSLGVMQGETLLTPLTHTNSVELTIRDRLTYIYTLELLHFEGFAIATLSIIPAIPQNLGSTIVPD